VRGKEKKECVLWLSVCAGCHLSKRGGKKKRREGCSTLAEIVESLLRKGRRGCSVPTRKVPPGEKEKKKKRGDFTPDDAQVFPVHRKWSRREKGKKKRKKKRKESRCRTPSRSSMLLKKGREKKGGGQEWKGEHHQLGSCASGTAKEKKGKREKIRAQLRDQALPHSSDVLRWEGGEKKKKRKKKKRRRGFGLRFFAVKRRRKGTKEEKEKRREGNGLSVTSCTRSSRGGGKKKGKKEKREGKREEENGMEAATQFSHAVALKKEKGKGEKSSDYVKNPASGMIPTAKKKKKRRSISAPAPEAKRRGEKGRKRRKIEEASTFRHAYLPPSVFLEKEREREKGVKSVLSLSSYFYPFQKEGRGGKKRKERIQSCQHEEYQHRSPHEDGEGEKMERNVSGGSSARSPLISMLKRKKGRKEKEEGEGRPGQEARLSCPCPQHVVVRLWEEKEKGKKSTMLPSALLTLS